MSADFFRGEQQGLECFNENAVNNAITSSEDKSGKKTNNDVRLQDIEEQLEMAESRCNNLKDQLDHMKQIYGVNKNAAAKSRKISNLKNRSKESLIILDETEPCNENTFKEVSLKNMLIGRQKSNAIETDNTGAAVRTINNILNGITNSVNRLSEIHSQIATPRVKQSTGVSPIFPEQPAPFPSRNMSLRTMGINGGADDDPNQEEVRNANQERVGVVPELKIESSLALTSKLRGQKRKAKSVKTSSQLTIKKVTRVEKKVKPTFTKPASGLEKPSSSTIKHRFLNKLNTKNTNLVEIYHNDAIKHSDSDESNLKKSRQQNDRTSSGEGEDGDENNEVPPLNMNILNTKNEIPFAQSAKTEQTYQQDSVNYFGNDPPQAPRTTVSCCYNKNYELPTVASRMKQVAKSYLGTLNLKTIPFCAAISTTQSHNIGINIQQVMNIIKNRQPINGISPTLAHNIGLAAEKINSKPFSTLVSTINSKIAQTASRCPLSNTYLNIQQLQEQAKTIPEDVIEEGDEDVADSPDARTMIITGPSGDMEIKTKNTPSWRMDKNPSTEQCTCINQTTIAFSHPDSRYNKNIRTVTENTLNSQILENRLKSRLRQYKATRSQYMMRNPPPQDTPVPNEVSVLNNQDTQNDVSLKGKEKNLKQVLTNLHSDFEALNKKYEDMSEKSQADGDETTLKELERLEAELNKKEEEITMVLALYKEVLALKQQVKRLKEKKSNGNLPSKDLSREPKNAKIKFQEYNNPEAAFHLTKLLRQIQHYQMRYKTNLSEE